MLQSVFQARHPDIPEKGEPHTRAKVRTAYESWRYAHAAGGVVMGADILQQFPVLSGSHEVHSIPHGGKHPGSVGGLRAEGAIPSERMRLLHFENTFGDVYASEYCLDAMISLVLLVMRSAKLDAARLARLTARPDAACPDNGLLSARTHSGRPERRLECLP